MREAGVGPSDRSLLALPLTWSVAWDGYAALLELGGLTLASQQPSLEEVADFAPTVLLSTLSDALRLAQVAAQQRVDLAGGPLRLAVITAEPGGSLEVTRRSVEDRWGAACLDVYALTELGVIGWGCKERRDGIHLDDGHLEVEVVEPESDRRVADGEMGELVVTTPRDWGTPLKGLHTGDLVRLRQEACSCGRGSAWAEGGVLGRVGDRLAVRGKMILPSNIEQIVRRHPAVIDFGLRAYSIRNECHVTVDLEITDAIATEGDRARVAAEVAEDVKRTLGLRLPCEVVAPGAISATHVPGRRARRLSRQ